MFSMFFVLQASEAWGIQCMRYEIRDIRMPSRIQEAMQMQVCNVKSIWQHFETCLIWGTQKLLKNYLN